MLYVTASLVYLLQRYNGGLDQIMDMQKNVSAFRLVLLNEWNQEVSADIYMYTDLYKSLFSN